MRIFAPSELGVRVAQQFRQKLHTNTRWIYDRHALLSQVETWARTVPWIRPYYAVKSNPLPYVLHDLINNNHRTSIQVGLDVASLREARIASQFTPVENTIHTNPHSIPHECDGNVSFHLKIVDSTCEVDLLHARRIRCPMLIRMNSGVNVAKINFHSKFGANLDEAREIMQRAQEHNFQVKGVSFHIGSGGTFSRRDAYQIAVANHVANKKLRNFATT